MSNISCIYWQYVMAFKIWRGGREAIQLGEKTLSTSEYCDFIKLFEEVNLLKKRLVCFWELLFLKPLVKLKIMFMSLHSAYVYEPFTAAWLCL